MSVANFKKIISGEMPVDFIFEDEQCVVFDEFNPQAPIHFLVVPKKVLPNLGQVQGDDEKLLGHLMAVAKNVALQKGLDRTGYHVLLDETYRKPAPTFLALHVFGRALHHMVWPTGPGCKL